MAGSASLFFDIFGRDRGVGAMLDNTGKKASGMGGKFGGVAAMATKMVAPLAALATGAAIGRFVNDSVEGFSQLEDATQAAGVVFGSVMPDIQRLADGAAKTMGMSKADVIDAATTFGIYGKSAGMAGKDLSGFSTQMTKVAADMASFRGTSPEEAVMAVGAAMRGEMEPIRKYGVLLDDATLRNRALKMGLISSTKEALTPQNKVLAAQQEILAQTTDAQGDFARSQNSTANTSKTLAAASENLRAQVGSMLAPAFTAARQAAIGFIGTASGMLTSVGPAFTGIVANIGPLVSGFFQLSGSVSPVHILLSALAPMLPAIGAAFAQLASVAGPLLSAALSALQPVVGAVIGVIQALVPVVLSLIPPIISIVTAAAPALMMILQAVIPVVLMVINQALIPLVQFIGSVLPPVINALLPVVSIVFQTIASVVSSVMQVVRGIIQVVLSAISGNWSGVWNGILAILGGIWGAIRGLIGGAIAAVGAVIRGGLSAVASFFGSTWSNIVSGVSGFIGRLMSFIGGIPGRILGALSGLGSLLVGVGRSLIQGLIDGVGGMIQNAVNAVANVGGAMLDGIKGFLGIKSPSSRARDEVGIPFGEGIIEGHKRITGPVMASAGRLGQIPRLSFGGSGLGAFRSGPALPSGAGSDMRPIYIQSPVTGEYLLARMDERVSRGLRQSTNDLTYRRAGV